MFSNTKEHLMAVIHQSKWAMSHNKVRKTLLTSNLSFTQLIALFSKKIEHPTYRTTQLIALFSKKIKHLTYRTTQLIALFRKFLKHF